MVTRFKYLQQVTIFLELERIDRYMRGLDPYERYFRQCPSCEHWHDAPCTFCSGACYNKSRTSSLKGGDLDLD